MSPEVLFYIALSAVLPAVIALVLWTARRHMWHTIALLSLLALGLGLASVVVLNIEYRSLGIDGGYVFQSYAGFGYSGGPLSDNATALLATYEQWRQGATSVAAALALAAWILGIYQAIQSRRWRWLAAIIICASLAGFVETFASLAGFVETFASNPWIFSIAPPFDGVLPTHPFAKVLLLVMLPYLAPAVTALYSLVVLRRAAANEPVPSAAARPSLAAVLSAPPPDVPFEDVVFEVEEMPRR